MKNIPHPSNGDSRSIAIPKIKKTCLEGGKHKYVFIRNITITKATYSKKGSRMHISYRGEYKCACGKMHIGAGK